MVIAYSPSKKKYPDIWVSLNGIPVITVTDEFRRQDTDSRRSRLTHEILHIAGMEHGKIGGYDYNTIPKLDSFSKRVYRSLIK